MNELQQVLLIFAVVVVIALYFLSRNRQSVLKKERTQQDEKQQQAESSASYQKASHALNELGEPHIPASKNTEARLAHLGEERVEPEVSKDQAVLPFGDEFEAAEQLVKAAQNPREQDQESMHTPADELVLNTETVTPEHSERPSEILQEEATAHQSTSGGKHHVLVVDDLNVIGDGSQYVAPEHEKPSFGLPEDGMAAHATEPRSAEKKEPQVFVILVMSAGQEFSMLEVNQALLGVGLSLTEGKIYVKCDNMGNHIIKVANLMEPGIFPIDTMETSTTCGVAMILELPATVKAPAAMHDLIMMARKISQRLQGRLYNMERQLLKESDLQTMRDEAVKYESEPL
ncbi:MAG: cell division-like protein [Thiomicrorhabdus sp.]|nr:cell division-like protein [Thiomicrorhabdus sp.]